MTADTYFWFHQVCFLVGSIQLTINIAYGFGKPGKNINPAHAYTVGFGGLILGAMVILVAVWSKTSFVLTLTRISGPKLTIALWLILVSMNVFQITALIAQWTQCTPLEKVWNRLMPGGTCWSREVSLTISMFAAGK